MSTNNKLHTNNNKLSGAIRLALGLSVGVLTFSIASNALAQEEGKLEEVFVTATKREVSVRDLPYNITAVTGDMVEKLGVTDVADIAKVVPGIVVSDSGMRTGFITSAIIIRGMNVDDAGALISPSKGVPSVSIYVNDTPLYANLQIMDVERIELLRGPQGTLYGSGSMGGNLRYVMRKPDLEGFSGEFTADISQTSSAGSSNYGAQVILNLPVSENFGFRLNASYRQEAGFMDHNGLYAREGNDRFNASALPVLANPGDPVGSAPIITSVKDADDADALFFRAAALYEHEHFSLNLNYFHQEMNTDSAPMYHFKNADDEYTNSKRTLEPFENTVDLASLEVQADLGFATLTSVTSYSDTSSQGLFDLTDLYVNFPFYPFVYGNSPRPIIVSHSQLDNEDFTQEFRLVSNGDGRIDWLIGAFYHDSERNSSERQYFPGYADYANACFPAFGFGPPICGFGSLYGVFPNNGPVELTEANKDLAYLTDFQDTFKDVAIFGEITLHVTDAWQITGGVRIFDQEYTVTEQGGLVFVPGGVVGTTNSFDDSDELFKLNTSYSFGDHQVYAVWSEGFRRGGANALGALGTPETSFYLPDEATNIEIGVKGLINDRIEYTLGYFDVDWKNIQTRGSCTPLFLQCTVGAGEATSKGVEAELIAQLSDSFQLRAGYTYVDATLDKPSELLATPGPGTGKASPGDRLPGTPKSSGNITGLYVTELKNGWVLDANATYSYLGKRTTRMRALESQTLDSYAIVDASVAVSSSNWTMRLFAVNLFDENARISQNPTTQFGDLAPAMARRPRTIGLSVNYRF